LVEPCNPHFGPLAIVSVVLYRFSFAIGLGPIPWILISELLPLSVRGVASGLVTIVTWGTSAIINGLLLKYVELVNFWFAIWTLGVFNLASVIFVIIFVPETKGKSLEQLERKFVKQPDIVETVL
jgi:MFS family permease